ncbi:hypothetical protein NM208_g13519 [Fusarium decemcellulare]|uniref:Uncharacterized protein n=1 Tax=Fusarium decemcellulare TaxID=57161 RepID=A0ACC1RLG8_9HYPO|nr:hypothetical protein NM208_g13519 [Fusarium decemcellulare]
MSESRKSKSPLRALDPQPVRSPSPSDGRGRGPERTKSYPGPESQQYGPQPYNPQDYANQSYNPQSYGRQDYSQQNFGGQSSQQPPGAPGV